MRLDHYLNIEGWKIYFILITIIVNFISLCCFLLIFTIIYFISFKYFIIIILFLTSFSKCFSFFTIFSSSIILIFIHSVVILYSIVIFFFSLNDNLVLHKKTYSMNFNCFDSFLLQNRILLL